jgi:DNA-binding MarR family transcriptional regulator
MNALLQRHLNRRLQAASGLSVGDYEVLVFLSESEAGRLRVGELGELIQWDSSRLSHHLGRMEKRGLLRREVSTSDRRGFEVVISAEGSEAIRSAAACHAAEVRRVFFDVVDAEQVRMLSRLTSSVLAHLDQE